MRSLSLLFLGAGILFAQAPFSITTIAGADAVRDGGSPTKAILGASTSLAFDSAGNLYIADPFAHRIRKVTLGLMKRGPEEPYVTGIISTVAGDGAPWFNGDGGPATEASLAAPAAIAFNSTGDLYIADNGNRRIRRVDAATGIIETIAGTGVVGISEDGASASEAALSQITSMVFDESGALLFTELGRVRMITTDGIIQTIAGGGTIDGGDGEQATSVRLLQPQGLAIDKAGNVLFAEAGAAKVRKVTPEGIITTIAGNGTRGRDGEGGPAIEAQLALPTGVAAGRDGSVYFADSGNLRVQRITPAGILTPIVTLPAPWLSIAMDPDENLIMSRGEALNLWYEGQGGLGAPIIGDAHVGSDRVPALQSLVYNATGVTSTPDGRIYIAQPTTNVIKVVNELGIIDSWIFSPFGLGDGGPVNRAGVSGARAIASDPQGVIYIADTAGNRIRRVGLDGIIQTIAGTGQNGSTGDGGQATEAQIRAPNALAVDAQGNVYFSEIFRIRKVTPEGIISTVAGNGQSGATGDGGPAIEASINANALVTVDAEGNVYVAAPVDGRIRRIAPDGVIETIEQLPAGIGPRGLAVDAAGNLLYTAGYNVYRRTPDGETEVIAGGERPGANDLLNTPTAIWVEPSGTILVVDAGNQRIVRLTQ